MNKTILITGASQGIGRRLALHFGRRHARVLGLARNPAGLRAMAAEVQAAGGTCSYWTADLTRVEELRAAVKDMNDHGERVHVLINNAADVTSKPLRETSLDEIHHLIAANVIGPLQLVRLVLPLMPPEGPCAIVNISSLAGYKPNPAQTVYSVSKGAVNAMSDALRAELRGTHVRVINVALSSVALDGPPRPDRVPVERVALAIERAIERGPNEVFLSPLTKWLMRAYRAFPPLMNWR